MKYLQEDSFWYCFLSNKNGNGGIGPIAFVLVLTLTQVQLFFLSSFRIASLIFIGSNLSSLFYAF